MTPNKPPARIIRANPDLFVCLAVHESSNRRGLPFGVFCGNAFSEAWFNRRVAERIYAMVSDFNVIRR